MVVSDLGANKLHTGKNEGGKNEGGKHTLYTCITAMDT